MDKLNLSSWRVKGKVKKFPIEWDKYRVMKFLNSPMNLCDYCGKIDINSDHFEKCDPAYQRAVMANREMNEY